MLQALLSGVLDIFIPPRRSDALIRSVTLGELQSLHLDISKSQAEGLLPYHDPRVTALVWELKYYANTRAAALAALLLHDELLALASEELGKPLLVPAPMHQNRRRERGHNQTEVLCKALLFALRSSQSEVGPVYDYAPKALTRHQDTRPQQGLERMHRLRNVQNSMTADTAVVNGRVCVVVDDVTTTGATLAECKRALRDAGARRVHLVALARS